MKRIGSAKSVQGVLYRIDMVNDKYVIGTRSSTLNEFKIETDGLLMAYNDIVNKKIPMTTTALRDYVNRTQSPALAIIKALHKLNNTF